ncbi:MAG: SPOR domain-containing protein [Candidatus Omnitrophica bacterium]|nr:SPOR domain-containing protein [Candidatus Omnitrophota bacterium]
MINKILRLSGILCLGLIICVNAYALNLDKIKVYFLQGEYKAAIQEGEKILAASGNTSGIDELYYFLGLSYMKDQNYLRASDIFEIILKEFHRSDYREEARLGLGDTYLLRQDYSRAQAYYQEILKDNPETKLKALILSRLSQVAFKMGDTQSGQGYADELKQISPANLELVLDKDICPAPVSTSGFYYTVQVGSFVNSANASGLAEKLKQKGYDAFIQEDNTSMAAKSWRVRVGRLATRQEAQDLEKRLLAEGYPTKICP